MAVSASLYRSQRSLFRKYAFLLSTLVGMVLATSGGLEMYFSYQDNKSSLRKVQREKAETAASVIEQFLRGIESQIGWTKHSAFMTGIPGLEERRIDFLRLLRQEPAITEIRLLDPAGREQLKVSRHTLDAIGSQADFSRRPVFRETRLTGRYFGPVYFRKESEPYVTLAVAEGRRPLRVVVAEVSLKFIWNEISSIKVGEAGYAFAVDSRGLLIAHPDISLVLQKTPLLSLPHISLAVNHLAGSDESPNDLLIAENMAGLQVLSAHAAIDDPGWLVFVELPLSEAFAPLYGSMIRFALLLVLGLIVSLFASLVLARRMVRPIRLLQAGAARIGDGNFGREISIRTGDELEALGNQINKMASDLRDREMVRDLFGKFVPRDVANAILEDRGALRPQTLVATILFSDIVGFSSITEAMPPERVIEMLNEYFSLVAVPIERNGGVIEQFHGDGLMATYNVPIEDPDHAAKAVRSALEIQSALAGAMFNIDDRGKTVTLATRIGINTGLVVGGTVGSSGRLGYAVYGDTVNVAARIEQLNKTFNTNILVAQATVDLAGSEFFFDAVGDTQIRGRQQAATLYSICSSQP